jgi:uncharacterized protein (DUF1697 family)
MTAYASMLRAVNLPGHQQISMPKLAAAYESIGFSNVRTYIQSGNVVFESTLDEPEKVEKLIESKITEVFGFSTPVMARTSAQMRTVVDGNPFPESYTEELAVAFLSGIPTSDGLDKVMSVKDPAEELIVSGSEIYLYYPNGQGRSKLNNALLERHLKVVATVRNWRTVNKLLAMTLE